jgi:hypothetical protein
MIYVNTITKIIFNLIKLDSELCLAERPKLKKTSGFIYMGQYLVLFKVVDYSRYES